MNILFCSAGRRVKLLYDFRESMSEDSKIVACDNHYYAPALQVANAKYVVPPITDKTYVTDLLEICKKEEINAITTLIDPEITLLAKNRKLFEDIGVQVLAPKLSTAQICFDKYEMYKHLVKNNINTVFTCDSYETTMEAINCGRIEFPVFVKPRTGSASIGARKVMDEEELKEAFTEDGTLIAQEYMYCEGSFDLDADIYIDTISEKPVSVFLKKKISTTIGGANATVSFKDEKLFEFVKEAISIFEFKGPIDADFFYKKGEYYLSEINPRFGGGYLHAYGAGVDFVKMIENNINGIENLERIGDYESGITMQMYDDVIIGRMQNKTIISNSFLT